MTLWRRTLVRLDTWDAHHHGLLRRTLGILLVALFLGCFFAILYGWFRVMQPYAE